MTCLENKNSECSRKAQMVKGDLKEEAADNGHSEHYMKNKRADIRKLPSH